MKPTTPPIVRPRRLCVLLLAGLLVPGVPALAGPPAWAGGGKHGHDGDGPQKHKSKSSRALDDRVGPRAAGSDKRGEGVRPGRKPPPPGAYFDDRNRRAVHAYYDRHPGKACPPGLAKKHNGCLPPGQAKKWQVGHVLPAEVVFVPVPQPVRVLLPSVPPGHRYVQVAGDILLIAIGSKMVVDGIAGVLR